MNRANDLFLLLLNLSQMRSRSKVTGLFLESLDSLFAPQTFQLAAGEPDGTQPSFPIATRNSAYGYIVAAKTKPMSGEDQSLLHNAAQMLAVVLERLEFEEKLEKERSTVGQLADDRLLELQATVDQLRQSRNAYINLVEDLTRENEDRQRAEALLRQVATNLPGAVYQFIRRPDGSVEIPFMSEGAVLLLGRPLDELRDASRLFDDVHPDDLAGMWSSIQKSADSMSRWVYEFRIVGKTGETKWLRGDANPSALPDGGICWNGAILDATERKRAEAALRQAESRYRNFVSNASEGIYRIDFIPPVPIDLPETVQVERLSEAALVGEVNDALAQMYGLTVEAMVGHRATEFAPDYGKRAQRVLRSLAFQVRDEETQDVDPTGRTVHLLENYTGVIEQGRLVHIWGMQRDITERKITDQALRLNEALLAQSQQIAHIGSWMLDAATNRLIWSDETYRIFGLAPQQFAATYEAFLAAVHPEDRAAVDAAYSGSLQEGKDSYEIEHRIVRPQSGEIRCVYERCVHERDATGLVIRSVGMVQDITAQKQAEGALRASEEQHRNLIHNLNAGVVVHAPDTRILLFNKTALKLLGLSDDQMLGKMAIDPAWHFIHETGRLMPLEEYPVMQVLANQRPLVNFVLGVNRPASDVLTWVLVNAFPEFDDQKQLRQIVVTFLDITERKRAEAEREKLQSQLTQAQRMESIGRLAGGVAHDFNNMLAAILGNVSFALRNLPTDNPLRENLEEIEKCAHRSADLTRQLLAFARKQTVAPRVLDLNATVEGMLKMLRRLIGEHIDLAWAPASDLWPVRVDPSQVDQILANLCVNARDAITGIGRITLETNNTTFDETYVAQHPGFVPGDYVRICLSDNGCGMDQETLAHLFEPFFTTKGVGQGTGLGLATVYGIVRQNQGFIHVYSEPAHGTTFTIYLPRHTDKAERIQSLGPAPTVARGHETILLVEDEPSLLRIGKRTLEDLGYTLLAASTPGEAIRLAQEHPGPIHLLLTDVVMPEMNGRELAKRLLSLYPGLKRLFMSGYTADVIAHHGVLDEGIHFIQKPFTVESLADKVRDALSEESKA